jgi:hypothetical protein
MLAVYRCVEPRGVPFHAKVHRPPRDRWRSLRRLCRSGLHRSCRQRVVDNPGSGARTATRDEENARLQHEIADRLERAIDSENQARDWHLRMAQRLRDWLSANGG